MSKNKTALGRTCECGFKFSGPGEYSNAEIVMDEDGQFWLICPKCGKGYKVRD